MNTRTILIVLQIFVLALNCVAAIFALSGNGSMDALIIIGIVLVISSLLLGIIVYSTQSSSELSQAVKNYTTQSLPLFEMKSSHRLAATLINRLPWVERQQEQITKLLISTNE